MSAASQARNRASRQTASEKLDALYARIPKFECKSGCTDCCGPVPFSKTEWDRVSIKKLASEQNQKCLECPYAKPEGGCEIYEQRPLICRMFGAVDDPLLTCPHGCGPEKKLTKAEGNAMLDEYLLIRACE